MTDDTPATVGDLDDPDRELWVVPNTFGQSRTVHLEPDCRGIDDKEPRQTVARQEHIDTDVCAYCSGAWSNTVTTGTPDAKKLAEMDASEVFSDD